VFWNFLVVEGILLIMEKICRNCEYFVKKSLFSIKHQWGDCQEPSVKEASFDKKDVFKWSNGTCSKFKPKQSIVPK